MRCIFCDNSVLVEEETFGAPVTISGRGVAHSRCAELDSISRRVFGSTSLKDIEVDDLYELREFVLTEINDREGLNMAGVELF